MKTDLSLIGLFADASMLVQCVMLILLGLSIFSWSLILQRFKILKEAKRTFDLFQDRFDFKQDISRLYDYMASKRTGGQGIEQVFRAGFREFAKLYKQDALPQAVMEGTERALRVELSRKEDEYEKNLAFLATIGSSSVYIGLFGTVWGIITAFRALGSVNQATLAMVAPGISEALIATALGLFTAIPASFAYNYFTNQAQELIRQYDNLAEEFAGALLRRLYSGNWHANEANADAEEAI